MMFNGQEIKSSINKNALILAIFAFVSTGLIAMTYWLTKDKIALEVEQSLIRQISILVPKSHYNNNVYKDCLIINNANYLGSTDKQKAYRMRADNINYAVLITAVAPDGYSGKINIAIAISNQQQILGVSILNHQETPGLGDKIERNKSNWLNQFNQLSLNKMTTSHWKLKKDGGQFDALTGATITPRAVVKAISKSLDYFSKNKEILFNTKSNCEVNL